MSANDPESLIGKLPVKQREVARAKILSAQKFGWNHIDFIDGVGEPNECDLCGVNPTTGAFDFLPDVE